MALWFSIAAQAQTGTPSTNLPAAPSGPRGRGLRGMADSTNVVRLSTIHMQDLCILPDQVSKSYYMIASGGGGVRAYTSTDLVNWRGPKTIYRTPTNV